MNSEQATVTELIRENPTAEFPASFTDLLGLISNRGIELDSSQGYRFSTTDLLDLVQMIENSPYRFLELRNRFTSNGGFRNIVGLLVLEQISREALTSTSLQRGLDIAELVGAVGHPENWQGLSVEQRKAATDRMREFYPRLLKMIEGSGMDFYPPPVVAAIELINEVVQGVES